MVLDYQNRIDVLNGKDWCKLLAGDLHVLHEEYVLLTEPSIFFRISKTGWMELQKVPFISAWDRMLKAPICHRKKSTQFFGYSQNLNNE